MIGISYKFQFLVVLLIFLIIGISGCLQPKGSGQQSPNISATPIAKNPPVVSPTITTPVSTTVIPSEQSGVTMFRNPDSICIGQSLSFGLRNEGNSTIIFGAGNPYWIQFFNNGTWDNIFLGGGTQAFWELHPANEIKRGWGFTNNEGNGLYEFYNKSGPLQQFTVRPGLYRIIFLGKDENSNESFTVATEFTIRQC